MPEEKTTDVVTPETDVTEEQQQQQPSTTDETTKRRVYSEAEFKDVVRQRDELKKKTREIEETKEKERLEALQKSGKFEELNQELSKRLADLETEKQNLLTKSEKYDILEQQIRNSLLEKIPEVKRKFVQRLTIEELKEFVALEEAQNTKVGTADAGRPGKGTIDISKITADSYSGLTPEQREELAQRYPQKYKEIYLQHSKRIKR